MNAALRHETEITPASDCIRGLCRSKGCPGYPAGDGRSHGIGSIVVRHYAIARSVAGPVVGQFVWSPGIYLPETPANQFRGDASGWDLGYHSPIPLWDEHADWGRQEHCDFMPNKGACYYDGSGCAADRLLDALLRNGSDAMWAMLDEYTLERLATVRRVYGHGFEASQ